MDVICNLREISETSDCCYTWHYRNNIPNKKNKKKQMRKQDQYDRWKIKTSPVD